MSTIPFEAFLANFSRLKAQVNSNPRNLSWRAKNDSSLGELACDLMSCAQQIEHGLATSSQKFAMPPTKTFAAGFREYRGTWKKTVDAIGAQWLNSRLEECLKTIDLDKLDIENPSLAAILSAPPDFSPSTDDAYALLDDIFWWANQMMENQQGTDAGDQLHKAFQAWEYFERVIGVDLQNIYRRWKKAQTVFVPPHVADAYGSSETGGLFDLLHEAHKAFVFGAHAAAVAMCRALTETILNKHYHMAASDLEGVIVLAEKQHPWMSRLALQRKRKLANKVLHDYQDAEEQAVIDFLACVKELIEKAPSSES